VADDNFRVWLKKEGVMPAETGKAPMASLLQKKGCLSCHSADGTKKVGPTFKGLFGSSVEVITSGKERIVVADEEYLRRSIADPKADIVKGFPPIMPQMKDEISPDELSELVREIQGLK
jgi:cytochrome c oxidase subunit 2